MDAIIRKLMGEIISFSVPTQMQINLEINFARYRRIVKK